MIVVETSVCLFAFCKDKKKKNRSSTVSVLLLSGVFCEPVS